MLVFALLLLGVQSIAPQSTPKTEKVVEHSWIHPNDTAYRNAIRDGFDGAFRIKTLTRTAVLSTSTFLTSGAIQLRFDTACRKI